MRKLIHRMLTPLGKATNYTMTESKPMTIFKRGDRIIRVSGNLPNMHIGDKVIAGTISENGRFVVINDSMYRTNNFKPLLTCKGNRDETNYS